MLQFKSSFPVVKPTLDDFLNYTLSNLCEDYKYRSVATFSGTGSLIDWLQLPPPRANKVTIIGINGPTCAGKTIFSQHLAEQLSSRLPAVELSLEWFLYDRDKRAQLIEDIATNAKAIPEVTASAWDVNRYVATLQKLKSMDGKAYSQRLKLDNLYDRTSGKQQMRVNLNVPYSGYLIVEGVSVLDIPDPTLIDCYIRLDVDNDHQLIQRIIAREASKPTTKRLPDEFLRRRYEIVDLNHMRYLRKISHNFNKYIINTTDFNRLEVLSNAELS